MEDRRNSRRKPRKSVPRAHQPGGKWKVGTRESSKPDSFLLMPSPYIGR